MGERAGREVCPKREARVGGCAPARWRLPSPLSDTTHLQRPGRHTLQLGRDADAPLVGHAVRVWELRCESVRVFWEVGGAPAGGGGVRQEWAPLPCSLFTPCSHRGTPHVPPHTSQQHTPALPPNMTTAPMDTAAAEDAAAAAAAPASTPSAPGVPASVCVHPLVLLSVVDHYHRVARDTRKRVVGCLLGEVSRGRVDVTNSFAGERRRGRGRRGAPSRTKTNGGRRAFDRLSLTPTSSTPLTSPLRGGRQGRQDLVPGPLLPGEHVRHVQEGQRCVGGRAREV